MNEQDLLNILRLEARRYSDGELARHSGLSLGGVQNFIHKSGLNITTRTLFSIAKACGLSITIQKEREVSYKMKHRQTKYYNNRSGYKPSEPLPITHGLQPAAGERRGECNCEKCGADVGVVEVHGHLQCAHCGHIIQDCCGE